MKVVFALLTLTVSMAFANGDNYESPLDAISETYESESQSVICTQELEQQDPDTRNSKFRMKCKCIALDDNPYYEAACNALPVAKCSKVGNIVCYPKCSY